jgi:GTP1/Obg family GTP-binding protein
MLLAFAATILVTAPATALAQAQGSSQQQSQVTDAELRAYAVAAVEIQRISEEWQPRLQATRDAEEQTQLRRQAEAEMIEAIRAEDLSLAQYNEIYRLAQSDPNVRQRITTYMQQAQ